MSSTSPSYFQEIYADCDDPWNFANSRYEQRKYALTVASLPKAMYANAYEPGCSIGVLTEHLAPRCHRLLATDMMEQPLLQASLRLEALANVQFEQRTIPRDWPDEIFDLVVLSEIAYYFEVETLSHITDLVVATAVIGAHVVGVHWRGETDYPLSGDEAHAIIGQNRALKLLVHHVEDDFVLDVWERI